MVSLAFCTVLVFATFTDIYWRIIPNLFPAIILVLALPDFHLGGGLLALPFLVSAMIFPGKVGGGDIKLVAAIGVFLGYHTTLFALIVAIITLIVVYYGKIGFKNPEKLKEMSAPLAPFLSFGVAIAYYI